MVRLRKKRNVGWIAAIALCLFVFPFPGRSHAPELHLEDVSPHPQAVEEKVPDSQEKREGNSSQLLSEPSSTETSQPTIVTIDTFSGVGEVIFAVVVVTPIILSAFKNKMWRSSSFDR